MLPAIALWICTSPAWGAKRYQVTGIVLSVDRSHRSFVASCKAIPGYMEAMAMPYSVRDVKDLDGIEPSAHIEFTLVVDSDRSYAEAIKIHRFESMEQESLRARRLQLLSGKPDLPQMALGQPIPDFTLTD